MILVDTSVWVRHLKCSQPTLVRLLESAQVLAHPYVIGELALGGSQRIFMQHLRNLPQAEVASDEEVLDFIQDKSLRLVGSRIGYVDTHLLAAALLMEKVKLWTHDNGLAEVAERLGVIYQDPGFSSEAFLH